MEIQRRRLASIRAQMRSGTLSADAQARLVQEANEIGMRYVRAAAERAQAADIRDRQHERTAYGRSYRPTHEFDPGEPPKAHARETQRSVPTEQRAARPRRRHRPWKGPRRKPKSDLSDRVLTFGRDRAWSTERKHRLAIRCKRNDAVIAHPSSAAAALAKLPEWSRAAVLRCLRGEGWTLADEAARRHVAWWLTLEDFAVPRAWTRPRRYQSVAGAVRFRGIPKYGMCTVGWTQGAVAIAMSGAAYSCAGADPIDPKTVGRHTALAEKYGGVHVVRRNPDAEAHLRGAPTESNARGWAINEYWIPAPHFAPKPGFFASASVVSFGVDGTPLDLAEALAIELVPRPKWRQRKQLDAQPPPPLI